MPFSYERSRNCRLLLPLSATLVLVTKLCWSRNFGHQHQCRRDGPCLGRSWDKTLKTFLLHKMSLLQGALSVKAACFFHFYKIHSFVLPTQVLNVSHFVSICKIHSFQNFLLSSYFFHC